MNIVILLDNFELKTPRAESKVLNGHSTSAWWQLASRMYVWILIADTRCFQKRMPILSNGPWPAPSNAHPCGLWQHLEFTQYVVLI